MNLQFGLTISFILFLIIALFITDISAIEKSDFRVKLNEKYQFIDQYGRVRMFHGFNSVKKEFPWYDNEIYNETRMKLYKEWGFNVVRLGTMWSGAQPVENEFNKTYIEFMQSIVKRLSNYGIYSLLDMHQDVLSSAFKTYDGIPLWLINKFPKLEDYVEFPFPLKPNRTYFWSDYYVTFAACEAYQNLYHNELGISSWINFWKKIATEFRNLTSVIGYELINEPWVGNFYTKPELLLPGNAGKMNLLPAYDRVVEEIRKIDNDTLIFYEPVTLGAYLPTTGPWGTGFDRIPGNSSQKTKSVLSYHYYCFFLTTANASGNYGETERFICDNIMASQLFQSVQDNINKTKGGSFLTEFGGCEPDGNPKSINTIECDVVLSLAEKYYQSYTYWNSNFFDNLGNIRPYVIETFARAYPRALQGQPIHYSFNRISHRMILVYRIDVNIKAPTEIFLPITVHYSTKGFRNTTLPLMKTSFDETNFLFTVSPPADMVQGTVVSLIIDSNS